ncbi:hypothetical protein ES703_50472 [subsurface metagenome]
MAKRYVRPTSPEMEYREIRVKVPKKVYQAAKAVCHLKEIQLSGLITAYLARWAKSAVKELDDFTTKF